MTQSAAFIPADQLRPAVNPLAAGAGAPVINPLVSPLPAQEKAQPAPDYTHALTPEQQASVEAIRRRRAQNLGQQQAGEAQQAALEQRYGKWETAGFNVARGLIDAVLSPGAMAGMQAEWYGTVAGADWLRDFGRDLGESSNSAALLNTMSEAFAKPDAPMAPGTSAPTPYELNRRIIEEGQKAWPLLSGFSRVAGMAIPAIATAGVGSAAGAAGGAAAGASNFARIGGAAAVGGLEGMAGGAQSAYEDSRPLRDVVTQSLLGGVLGAGLGGGFAGVSSLAGRGTGGIVSNESLEAFAEGRVSKALNARASELNKLPERGRQMSRDLLNHRLDDGMGVLPDSAIKAGRMPLDDIAERVTQGKAEVGSKLDDLRTSVSSYIEEAAPELRPNVSQLINRLQREVVQEVADSPILASKQGPLLDVLKEFDNARVSNKLLPAPDAAPKVPAGTSFDEAATEAGKLADTLKKTEVLDAFLNRERKAVSLAERAKAENKLSGEVNEFLSEAQQRGAVYNGKVYRGTNDTELEELVKTGRTTHTLSASSEPEGAAHFAKKGGVLLEIEDHPVPMDGIPGSNTFSETLIPKGSVAKVVGEREVDGLRIVTLKIRPAGDVPAKRSVVVQGARDDGASMEAFLKARKHLKAKVYDSNQLGSNVGDAKLLLKKMERIVDETYDEAVEKAVSRMDDTMKGRHKELQRLWQSFHHADQILQGSKGLQGALARSEGNAFFSLSSTLTGTAALAGDIAGGGGAFSAAKGLGSALAHKYAREHGSAFFAVLANNMAKRGVRVPELGTGGALSRAFALGEGDVMGHLVAPSLAGGREGQLVLSELERSRLQVASAVEAAGPNPEQRERARQEAITALSQRMAQRAGDYDAARWFSEAPTPLQKVVYRKQILDQVSEDVAGIVSGATRLFPGADFDLRTDRISRFTRNAKGPEAVGSIQARVRSIFENAPPTVEGDALRVVANDAMYALQTANVSQAMALGHTLARELGNAAKHSPEELTRSYAAREASGFADDLGSDAFGDAGKLYRRMSSQGGDSVSALSDPAAVREVLRTLDLRGRLPAAAKELAKSVLDAHEARMKLTGQRPPAGLVKGVQVWEQRLAQAEDAVTLDGGPVGRVLDHFNGKTANVDRASPEDMVLRAVRPKMEGLLPTLGKAPLERTGAPGTKPGPATLPKSRGELQTLHKQRLEFLSQAAVSPEDLPLDSQLQGLPNIPPQLAALVTHDAHERIQTLLRDMPKPREDIRGKAYESLSSEQLRVANAMWEATTAPMSVFDDFQRGLVDYDKVQYAWKQYPGLKQAAQVGLFDALHSHLDDNERASIPDRTLTQLDYLLGFQGKLQSSVSREFSQRITVMHEELAKQTADRSPPGGQLNMPTAAPTFTQRISGSGKAA